MTILQPAPVSTSRFTYDPAAREFTAEASDLSVGATGQSIFGRVYDDACDIGLTLISTRSGKPVVCAIDHEERDAEGDLLFWVLKPVTRGAPLFTVTIFND